MARPQLNIGPEQVQKLASIRCTMEDIAVVAGCSVDTLARRYVKPIKGGRAHRKSSLGRWQLESAKKGDVTMLRFGLVIRRGE